MSLMDRVIELASGQYGVIAANQLVNEGYSSQSIIQLAVRGKIERIFHGVYIVPTMARSRYSEFMEAVLWSGGVVTGESSILLWDLADVNPSKIHVAIDKRIRREIPGNYSLYKMSLNPKNLDHIEDVPSTTVNIAIGVAIDNGSQSRLIKQAINNALAREMINDELASRLKTKLYDRDGGLS